MFLNALKPGAIKRLHTMLRDPISFDSIEFVRSNHTQLINLPSDINDLYFLCSTFEENKRKLYPILSKIIYDLSSNIGLVGINNAPPKDLPIQLDIDSLDSTNGVSPEIFKIDVINQQLERLYECLEITSGESGNNVLTSEVNQAIEFFLLSEHFYLTFYGLARVEKINGILKFSSIESLFESFYKPKWFANFWEQSSSASTLSYFDFIPNGTPVAKGSHFIKTMSHFIMDKVFTINHKHLSGKLKRTEGFQMMNLICTLSSLLIYMHLKIGKDFADKKDLSDIGLSTDDLQRIRKVNTSLSATDRIFKFSGGRVSLCNSSISIHSRKFIETFIRISEKNGFDNVIGKHFEGSYIPNYIKETINSGYKRYTLHGEVLAHQIHPKNKHGDIDLIVEDTLVKRFIFMQIKYIRNAGRPFLKGDVEYLTNKHINHGINQLSSISDFHKNGGMDQVLEEKGIKNCSPENTIYMLVSNVTNLDFQKERSKNIVFYEWNTLRNLLMDGQCFYGQTNDPTKQKEWRYHTGLPLAEPSKVIDILISNNPALRMMDSKNIFLSKHFKTIFKSGNIRCISHGLGM